MHSTLNPKPTDDPHDILVVAPDAVGVAPADEELSSLLQQAARQRSDSPIRAVSDLPAGPAVPPVDATFRASAVNDVAVAAGGSSMARRAMRAFTALLLAACIGVATFAWRAYGDTVERKIAKWTTQFVLTVSLPPEKPAPAVESTPPAVQAATADATPAQPAASAQTAAEVAAPAVAAPATAAPSSDPAPSLQSMARDLASLGQEVELLKASLEQLKTSQQQMSRDVTRSTASETRASEVKASEPSARPRIAALPPRPAAARARKPMPSYYSPPQAAVAPALPPQAAAPYPAAPAPYYVPRQTDYVPRQAGPPPEVTGEQLTDPELSSVPRPPMPVR
jgi:hypothetical protein